MFRLAVCGLLCTGTSSKRQGGGQRRKEFQQIVHSSSSRRIGAEFLADADQYERLHGGVPLAFHSAALPGRVILCAIATRFAAVGRPGGPTLVRLDRAAVFAGIGAIAALHDAVDLRLRVLEARVL